MMNFELNDIDRETIALALAEDLNQPYFDATSEFIFESSSNLYRAQLYSKNSDPLVLCGLPVAQYIWEQLDPRCEFDLHFSDGDVINKHDVVMDIHGPAIALLSGERIVLNFLRHLSGIATYTQQFVREIAHTSCNVLDTRKTTPGLRHLEKYAVMCGGGVNHRMGLYDAIMLKDTHCDLLGGIDKALHRLAKKNNTLPVIVEVRNQLELNVVLDKYLDTVNRVLLDNMQVDMLRTCVSLCKNKISTEASGNIKLDTIKSIAETGVNFASIGCLTYGAGQVDIAMRTLSEVK